MEHSNAHKIRSVPRAKGRLPKCCHTDGVDGSIALLGTCCVGFTPVVSLASGEIKESHRVESEVVGLGGRVVTVVTVVSVTGPRNGVVCSTAVLPHHADLCDFMVISVHTQGRIG